MNALQIFNYQEKQVRTVLKDGEPHFVAVDVCNILGLSNPSESLKSLDDDERSTLRISEGGPEANIITEAGLYSLILRSNKPEAKQFKRWAIHDVLPSIRKHGMYAKDELLDNPDLLIEVATRLKEEKQKNQLLNTENKLLAQERLTWSTRKLLEALVKKYGSKIGYDNAWREFKKELLYAYSIHLNLRITNWRNETGRKTGPKTLDMIHDEELPACISTAVALCRNNGITIDDILNKYKH
jgi:prophage antirepressor-like protein